MNADCKGALAALNQSYKAFVHQGNRLSKQAVKEILEYAISKGYDHTGLLKDSEIDSILTNGTTIEQWERYYEDKKRFDEFCERAKPVPPPEYFEGEDAKSAWSYYNKLLSEWEMMLSCDEPNKPDYYRANND